MSSVGKHTKKSDGIRSALTDKYRIAPRARSLAWKPISDSYSVHECPASRHSCCQLYLCWIEVSLCVFFDTREVSSTRAVRAGFQGFQVWALSSGYRSCACLASARTTFALGSTAYLGGIFRFSSPTSVREMSFHRSDTAGSCHPCILRHDRVSSSIKVLCRLGRVIPHGCPFHWQDLCSKAGIWNLGYITLGEMTRSTKAGSFSVSSSGHQRISYLTSLLLRLALADFQYAEALPSVCAAGDCNGNAPKRQNLDSDETHHNNHDLENHHHHTHHHNHNHHFTSIMRNRFLLGYFR